MPLNATTEDIPELVRSCFQAFADLRKISGTSTDSSIAQDTWEDETGRLRVWAGNIGAHQTGNSSLAYRLRHAPSIRQEVVDSLLALLDALREARNVLSSTHSDAVDDGEPEDDDDQDEPYLKVVFDDVVDAIDGLYRLTTHIRQPSRRDQLLDRSIVDTAFEPYDTNHIANRFPSAESFIIERLGRANTQRRANFRYLERHRQKMSVGLSGITETQSQADGVSHHESGLSETIASDLAFSAAGMTSERQRSSQPIDFQDDMISNAPSATSYASSLFNGHTRLPSLPEAASTGAVFECPICYYMIQVQDLAAWRKHVFVDLQPYVCLFPDCPMAHRLFTSRHEWFAHETSMHLKTAELVQECPLCKCSINDVSVEKHLARHLEDLALFSLPSSLFGEQEDIEGFEDDSESSSTSQTDSHPSMFYPINGFELPRLVGVNGIRWADIQKRSGCKFEVRAQSVKPQDMTYTIKIQGEEPAQQDVVGYFRRTLSGFCSNTEHGVKLRAEYGEHLFAAFVKIPHAAPGRYQLAIDRDQLSGSIRLMLTCLPTNACLWLSFPSKPHLSCQWRWVQDNFVRVTGLIPFLPCMAEKYIHSGYDIICNFENGKDTIKFLSVLSGTELLKMAGRKWVTLPDIGWKMMMLETHEAVRIHPDNKHHVDGYLFSVYKLPRTIVAFNKAWAEIDETQKEKIGDQHKVYHEGLKCDGPSCIKLGEYFTGVRYKCSICPDVDYCEECVKDESNPHNRSHAMMEIPFPTQCQLIVGNYDSDDFKNVYSAHHEFINYVRSINPSSVKPNKATMDRISRIQDRIQPIMMRGSDMRTEELLRYLESQLDFFMERYDPQSVNDGSWQEQIEPARANSPVLENHRVVETLLNEETRALGSIQDKEAIQKMLLVPSEKVQSTPDLLVPQQNSTQAKALANPGETTQTETSPAIKRILPLEDDLLEVINRPRPADIDPLDKDLLASSKLCLETALRAAHEAVALDNSGHSASAALQYSKACSLLKAARWRMLNDDDRVKIKAILTTYENRIAELNSLPPYGETVPTDSTQDSERIEAADADTNSVPSYLQASGTAEAESAFENTEFPSAAINLDVNDQSEGPQIISKNPCQECLNAQEYCLDFPNSSQKRCKRCAYLLIACHRLPTPLTSINEQQEPEKVLQTTVNPRMGNDNDLSDYRTLLGLAQEAIKLISNIRTNYLYHSTRYFEHAEVFGKALKQLESLNVNLSAVCEEFQTQDEQVDRFTRSEMDFRMHAVVRGLQRLWTDIEISLQQQKGEKIPDYMVGQVIISRSQVLGRNTSIEDVLGVLVAHVQDVRKLLHAFVF